MTDLLPPYEDPDALAALSEKLEQARGDVEASFRGVPDRAVVADLKRELTILFTRIPQLGPEKFQRVLLHIETQPLESQRRVLVDAAALYLVLAANSAPR